MAGIPRTRINNETLADYGKDRIQVSEKVTEFKIEIIPEIFSLENRLRYFCKAGTCSYLNG